MEHGVVLCGANSYEQKYYFNEEDFGSLPESIKKELHIMCVLYTEDVGGVLTMEFDGEGNLQFTVEADASDYLFDEIGSALKIKRTSWKRESCWSPWSFTTAYSVWARSFRNETDHRKCDA